MTPAFENIHRIVEGQGADPVAGQVVWSPAKSLFLVAMYGLTVLAVVRFFAWDAVAVFVVKTAAVLLLGHSVGMHRRLIHNSFECPQWLEYVLVYTGVLVGLGGPFTMIRTHDMRDWAQRKPWCHDYFAHRRSPFVDALWQIHGEVRLDRPPQIVPEPRIASDRFYHFIERHWIAAHLPWAMVFYAAGGWAWVLWGVCAKVAATVTGHWLIGYMAHRDEPSGWHVRGAGVQGHNVPFCGLITMGECWHSNHHAFPGSARIGLEQGQPDPGWGLIQVFAKLGLAWNIRTAEDLPYRPELAWAGDSAGHKKTAPV
ncbi:MAG: acyl-CoA desaturase [Pseudomonadota bacterium]|nr:acyl-CoA desaturase [Pseudomonadota bacterium]